MPLPILPQQGAPQVTVGVQDVPQRGREHFRIWEGFPGIFDHPPEGGRVPCDAILRPRAGNAKRQLEILLIADEDVRKIRDARKGFGKLFLPPLPE